jgi:lysine 2,3-aminomutase
MTGALTSWTHKLSTAFKDARALYEYLEWPLPSFAEEAHASFAIFVPRRIAQKIKAQGPLGPLACAFLPSLLEAQETGLLDPIGDRTYNRAPQLIHRYPSRALFTPTSVCPIHCRYCFRRNELNPQEELFKAQFKETLEYLRTHPEISELIFTGGDPLTLSNSKLEFYLSALSGVPHLKDIRFHTRYPVILPERIDSELTDLLSRAQERFRTVSVAIHANHISEFDEDSEAAIAALRGVQLLSQTVLLKGVNDQTDVLAQLMEKFISLKVRPYYLHHPDRVKGGMHFYIPLEEGRKIYGGLRGLLPGWALPHYVIDVPGGHGKVQAYNPERYSYSGTLLSQQGTSVPMPESDLFS